MHPADWIWDDGIRDPSVIWYWVNEDDCNADRKTVLILNFFQVIGNSFGVVLRQEILLHIVSLHRGV